MRQTVTIQSAIVLDVIRVNTALYALRAAATFEAAAAVLLGVEPRKEQ